MENENEEQIGLTPEQLEDAANRAKNSNGMILKWAETQGRQIIKTMELRKHALTLNIYWGEVRKGWLGGFMSGVQAGFQVGYKSAHKLTEQFMNGIDAVVVGTQVEAIKRKNEDLKTLLGEAIGEASMCWANPEKAGEFNSEKAEQIVSRLYDRFSTPVPPMPKGPATVPVTVTESQDLPKQESLPGL